MNPILLEVVTPDSIALKTEVEYLYLPGEKGEMGILEAHTPLISVLIPGELRYKRSGESQEMQMVIGAGFVEVNGNDVVVVTEIALTEKDAALISDHNYEKQIEEAKRKLESLKALSVEESAQFEASLARDLAILRFKNKNKISY